MFIVYYSNSLDVQKDILLDRMRTPALDNPFERETILVQSPGMAQWLQLKIAEKQGVAANLAFPMPASFIWQQYVDNLPSVAKQSPFHKDAMTWRLMGLIKQVDFRPHFQYLTRAGRIDQQRLYQLARKIADLFDQYLVYRPEWIMAWERGDEGYIERQIETYLGQGREHLLVQIKQDIAWQGALWRALVNEITASQHNSGQHRARLHQQYLQKLQHEKPKNLPTRLFIFGISALPQVYLETLHAISRYCDIHLFFHNPSQYYWGDIVDPQYLQKLKLGHRTLYESAQEVPLFSAQQLHRLQQEQFELTSEGEKLQIGHPLLAAWGKLGRDFFYLLGQMDVPEIQAYVESSQDTLLAQLQNRILNLTPDGAQPLTLAENDHSLSIHACHSAMREVEVLHDYLLQLFQQDNELTPKDIVVMVADVDKYAPYIQAVFRQYEDQRQIPFSIADGKLSESDVLIAAFISLLQLKDAQFSAEEVLAWLDIPAIRGCFGIELNELENIRHWTADSGVRFGLDKYSADAQQNYNAWQAGLERMLLGYAIREEDGIWQDSLGFDSSYGLKGQLVGRLAAFIEQLSNWHRILQQDYQIDQWQHHLTTLADHFFVADEQTSETLQYIKNTIQQLIEQLQEIPFEQSIGIEVIAEVMAEKLDDNDNNMKFLVGKVSFCTLLPMRSIPFKVVCLLGMNDGDYPRRQAVNSFDLMQYYQKKGDRSRRDDDRYLFLEALLAAEKYLYISYVGHSIIDNSAQEPSVLVNQLLDYLTDNLVEGSAFEQLVRHHSMTIFSPENFGETHRTFAKEWLPLAKNILQPIDDFIQPVVQTDPEQNIEFTQLIQFVQNPIRFFFEKQLGVYFHAEDELIDESENFSLEGLDLYTVNELMLTCADEAVDEYFARLKVKGVLPRGAFAQVYENKVRSELAEFRQIVKDWLVQTPDSRLIELSLATAQGEILLHGRLDRLFGEQRVSWRVGKQRESDVIENWLYYLLQCAVTENCCTPPIFYTRGENGKVDAQTFKTLTKEKALEQLQVYVEAYLQGLQQLQFVPTKDIAKWLKEEDLSKLAEYLNKSADGDEYQKGDIYWQRVLTQSKRMDFADIQEKVRRWFGDMLDSLIKEKQDPINK
ncbi:MAG TPA: exodeoxyribonuclease V subunit gamma [Pasteurellaceae bacterium]|nr:exodeoxyribonuclease V subunit gamma [Pasteurellaceae bacterium]